MAIVADTIRTFLPEAFVNGLSMSFVQSRVAGEFVGTVDDVSTVEEQEVLFNWAEEEFSAVADYMQANDIHDARNLGDDELQQRADFLVRVVAGQYLPNVVDGEVVFREASGKERYARLFSELAAA